MSCTDCGGIYDIVICKGETFRNVVMWSVEPFVYKPITGVPQLAPLQLTVPGHDMVTDQMGAISDVLGMTEINAEEEPPALSEYKQVIAVDANTLEFNDINATSFDAYVSGGIVRYRTLVDLTGFLARIDIVNPNDGTVLFTLSTTNGRIIVDAVTKKITLYISDEDTALIDFTYGEYALELESLGNEITTLLNGKVRVVEEITTTETP
jgi:hypothetical protein